MNTSDAAKQNVSVVIFQRAYQRTPVEPVFVAELIAFRRRTLERPHFRREETIDGETGKGAFTAESEKAETCKALH